MLLNLSNSPFHKVFNLRNLGIRVSAYNTLLTETQKMEVLHNLVRKDCIMQFLITSPEALMTSDKLSEKLEEV